MGCKKSKPGVDVITATRRVRPADDEEVGYSSATPVDETDVLGGTIDYTTSD